jgi:hypothetical protein
VLSDSSQSVGGRFFAALFIFGPSVDRFATENLPGLVAFYGDFVEKFVNQAALTRGAMYLRHTIYFFAAMEFRTDASSRRPSSTLLHSSSRAM